VDQARKEVPFLLSASAVRTRANQVLDLCLNDRLDNFVVDLDRMSDAVDYVIDTINRRYPSHRIPFHSRWRHFEVEGKDRWTQHAEKSNWRDADTRARAEFDLAVISVLLDAGAGPHWVYNDNGRSLSRSEGLAIASLDMFLNGAFSRVDGDPLRVDAPALIELSTVDMADAFQISPSNPMTGIEGRLNLLKRLGALVQREPEIFGRSDAPRPGGFFDHIKPMASCGGIPAPTILGEVLRVFGPVWPSRLAWDGFPLGDCWRLEAMNRGGEGDLIPLHKLSQWLTYSLIEPLQRSGLKVTDLDGLTGLAEYRNGGLFLDTGVLNLRDAAQSSKSHGVDSQLVIEWRALTVALLDRLAKQLRERLDLDELALPLASVLEGGTWAAGRAIAATLRKDASPPIKVISDGTVF
jgi:Protein of unknown function (DUF1688)